LAAVAAWPLCCRSEAAAAGSYRFEGTRLVLDLRQTPQLRKVGSAVAMVDAARKVNLIVARVGPRAYAALDRTCTHGGAMCAYNHAHQTVQCTSLNHAEYDLQGTLLHGRTHGNLRAYSSRVVGTRLEIDLGHSA
jgi:nitrite reductase/ring-hydroxylating ferredoxin subunit